MQCRHPRHPSSTPASKAREVRSLGKPPCSAKCIQRKQPQLVESARRLFLARSTLDDARSSWAASATQLRLIVEMPTAGATQVHQTLTHTELPAKTHREIVHSHGFARPAASLQSASALGAHGVLVCERVEHTSALGAPCLGRDKLTESAHARVTEGDGRPTSNHKVVLGCGY